MGAGLRVIPQIISERNMVEVECPLCSETVDLGSDETGAYECPYCTGDLEYEPIQRNFVTDWIWKEYQSSPIIMKIKIGAMFFFFAMIFMVILLVIVTLLGGEPCKGPGCGGGGP